MRRTILLVATMGVALLVASSLALVSGLGTTGAGAAQAQSTSERQEGSAQQNEPRVESAAGRAQGRGVSMRPVERGKQIAPEAPREVKAPPLGLTERGKAALEQACRGEAQPAERRTIDAGALPSGPSTNGPENNEPQPDTPALGTSFLGVADTG